MTPLRDATKKSSSPKSVNTPMTGRSTFVYIMPFTIQRQLANDD
jgi:hypothetical protein